MAEPPGPSSYRFEGAGPTTAGRENGLARIAPEGGSSGPLFVPVDAGIHCAENVRADESILRRASVGARVAVLDDAAVSVGVGVDPSSAFLARARAMGLPVVRRTSGGTGLLHAPGDLAWTVVLPRRDPRVGRSYVTGYSRLGAGAVRFLETVGIRARWVPSSGTSPDYCTLGRRGYVLVVGDRVLGGAAQHVTRSALLHHGILPRTLDRPLIERVFDLPAEGGVDRLTCLEELGDSEPAGRGAVRLARALAEQLESD
jgi:lipoyl(octanoyl) transferase